MEALTQKFSVSVLICTRNRMDVLPRAIDSVAESTLEVKEIIVSDDSTNDETYTAMLELPVKYVRGPKRGLGANRNNALDHAQGDYVLFLDDDAMLGSSFLEEVKNYLLSLPEKIRHKAIVSGVEQHQNGAIVFPHQQDFLGFQRKPYVSDTGLSTIVINSTVFPLELFRRIRFDENIIYGCDEVDIATRAIGQGWNIVFCRTAINRHYCSDRGREYYEPYKNASRIYVTFKRYFFTEGSHLKGLIFIVVACFHHLFANLKSQGVAGVKNTMHTLKLCWQYLRLFLHEQKQ